MVKNPYKTMFRGTTNKKVNFNRPEGAGNFDNMDDHNIVQSVSTLQGTIQHTPTNPADIVNKAYVDEKIMELLQNYTILEDNVSSTVSYSGWAEIGNANNTNLAVWRIRRATADGNGDWIWAWAGGTDEFTNIWDDRLSLTYT